MARVRLHHLALLFLVSVLLLGGLQACSASGSTDSSTVGPSSSVGPGSGGAGVGGSSSTSGGGGSGGDPVDGDMDGFTDDVDCDDEDPDVNPDAEELCDTVDNDCDGETDEDDAADAQTWFEDKDGDNFGISGVTMTACDQPDGFAPNSGDCNDDDADFYPGAPETDCNDPNDYNCDGSTQFTDADNDGFAAC